METNLDGELSMMKEMGVRPNYSDVARRYGVDRHTVAKYWNGGGPQPGDVGFGASSRLRPGASVAMCRRQTTHNAFHCA